jgi:hypothetical protein
MRSRIFFRISDIAVFYAQSDEAERAAMLLSEARTHASSPVLDNIRIASPCAADWNAMTGDERVRHCGACKKDVFNLSALTLADC